MLAEPHEPDCRLAKQSHFPQVYFVTLIKINNF